MNKVKPRVLSAWIVHGCSWKGNTTFRNGHSVNCGHKDYRAFRIVWIAVGNFASRIGAT